MNLADNVVPREQRILIDACLGQNVSFCWRDQLLLIRNSGLPEVLREGNAQGAAILGLDGFELEGTTVHPRLDLIYDVERAPSTDPLAASSRWGDNIWVDVTLDLPD